MTRYIGLLRGINVTGNNMLKMDALRSMCESIGLRDVQTYLQSGNVVFSARRADAAAIRKAIGMNVAVILRTADELRDVIARNPLPTDEPSKLLVTFYDRELPPEAHETILRAAANGPEQVHVSGREVYALFPNGMGGTKLLAALSHKKIGGTGRNWRTVTKLLELAEG
jgi:uncharacterized protein (DUF1697 family)